MADQTPKTTGADVAAFLAKSALGAIPFVGPLAAEIVGVAIPNQRLDRLHRLFQELEGRLHGFVKDEIRSRFQDPGFMDVLEDGMLQATRALSQDRIERIAALLKNGLVDTDGESPRYKHMLSLLGQLSDEEVILLCSYSRKYQDDSEFRARHESTLRTPIAVLGSSPVEFDAASVRGSHLNHLVRLDLLKNTFRMPKRGDLPEFDEYSGTLKATGLSLTTLGRLLLRTVDVLGPKEL